MYEFISPYTWGYEEKIEIVFYIEMQWYCLLSPLMFHRVPRHTAIRASSDNEIMLGQIMAWFASNIFVDDITFLLLLLCYRKNRKQLVTVWLLIMTQQKVVCAIRWSESKPKSISVKKNKKKRELLYDTYVLMSASQIYFNKHTIVVVAWKEETKIITYQGTCSLLFMITRTISVDIMIIITNMTFIKTKKTFFDNETKA